MKLDYQGQEGRGERGKLDKTLLIKELNLRVFFFFFCFG